MNFLQTLPYLGKITSYHLARNIGLDVAKPDRHLTRLSAEYGFTTAQEMCEFIAKNVGERIGTVDVILWRAINLGITFPLASQSSPRQKPVYQVVAL